MVNSLPLHRVIDVATSVLFAGCIGRSAALLAAHVADPLSTLRTDLVVGAAVIGAFVLAMTLMRLTGPGTPRYAQELVSPLKLSATERPLDAIMPAMPAMPAFPPAAPLVHGGDSKVSPLVQKKTPRRQVDPAALATEVGERRRA